MLSTVSEYAPRLTDVYMEKVMIDAQKSDTPADGRAIEGLWESRDSSLTERGGYDGHVAETSLYTRASLRPLLTGTVAAGAALAIGARLAYSIARRAEREH